MGILDFFKNLSKEEKKERKLTLDETSKLIDSFHEKHLKSAKSEMKEIKEKLNEEKESMNGNIKRLEEAELKHKAFPENVAPVMRDNRNSYLQKVKSFEKEIAIPEFEKIPEFVRNFDIKLNEFGKSTIRNYSILQQFFGEKIGSISDNISKIAKLVKQSEKIAKNIELEKISALKDRIKEIHDKINLKKELEEKIKHEREENKKITNRIHETEKKLKETEEGNKHKRYLLSLENKKETEKEIREIEKKPLHSFSVINDALQKYERISLENKLIKSYVENPLNALRQDSELKIVEIISKMKDILRKDGLELKSEKKEKIIAECDVITKEYLEKFLKKLEELEKKLSELDGEIKNNTITKEIEDLRLELLKEKQKLDETNHKISKASKDMIEIDVNKMKKALESDILEAIDEKVKIA